MADNRTKPQVLAEIFALPLIQIVTKNAVAEMLWKLGN